MNREMESLPNLTLEPIGTVRTGKQMKFEARHQPDLLSEETNQVILLPGKQFELALEDLEGFDHIWLIWWFHKNKTWRPRALPPRGPAKRRGLFSTRSPHRPNPIGLTCVRLFGIEGLTLTVGPLDLVDGTPILDIKPYIRTVDSFPERSLGWIGEVEQQMAEAPRFEIVVSSMAERQLAWLQDKGIDFTDRAFEILRIDPAPHRTRRILRLEDGRIRMACGPWRMYYRIVEHTVVIDEVAKGYSDETLYSKGYEKIPDFEAQIEFSKTDWSSIPQNVIS